MTDDPVEDVDPAKYVDAPANLRFINYAVDSIGYFLFAFIIGMAMGLLGLGDSLETMNRYVFGFFTIMTYYCLFEGITGRTPGKYLTRTKVITLDGKPPNFDIVAGRTLCRMIPFEPLSFLFASSGWHDRLTKTRVVMV